jgi:hypothetical protein
VANLSPDLNEGSLKQMFEPFGSVLLVNIMKDGMTGQSRGFGFVHLADAASARVGRGAAQRHACWPGCLAWCCCAGCCCLSMPPRRGSVGVARQAWPGQAVGALPCSCRWPVRRAAAR